MSPTSYRFLYNPRRISAEELRQTFVARHALLKQLLDHLRVHAQARSLQHLLLVGPRGSGKTHLLTVLRQELEAAELTKAWRPIQLAEEEWSVSTLRELILAAFESLAAEAVEDWAALPEHLRPPAAILALRAVPSAKDGGELGLALLNELARVTGRKNLLLLENLDTLLDQDFADDLGKRQLRSELMTGSNLLLIATSPGRCSDLDDHDSPLFGLLRPILLDDLTLDELEDLLRRRAVLEAESDPDGPPAAFLRRLRDEPHRVRALLFLTGGNPRTALMLYQVAVHGDLSRVRSGLDALLDELTPYFQSRLRELPTQERKIVDAIARSGRALRPSEIGAEIGVSAAQASALVGRLVDRGLVRLAEQREGRGRYYVLREVLYRYWRGWRSNRHDFSLLVDFLAAWFQRQELEDWRAGHPAVPGAAADVWHTVVMEALAVQPRVCDRLELNHTTSSRQDMEGRTEPSPDQGSSDPFLRRLLAEYPLPSDSLGGRLKSAAEQGDFAAADGVAADLCRALEQGQLPEDQELASLARVVAHGFDEQIVQAAQAVQRRRPQLPIRYLVAYALERSDQRQEALGKFLELLPACEADTDRFGKACCLRRVALLNLSEGRLEESGRELAEAKHLFLVLKEAPGQADCLQSLGDLALRGDDLEAARASYAEALPLYREIRERVGEANTLRSAARLLIREGKFDAALKQLDESIQISRAVGDAMGLTAGYAYTSDALTALQRSDEAVLTLDEGLHFARASHDLYNTAIVLNRQAQALAACGQGEAAYAALRLYRTFAERSQTPGLADIDQMLKQVREQLGRSGSQTRLAEIDADPEAVRQRGVEAVAAALALRRRMEAHQVEVEALTRVAATIRANAPAADEISESRQLAEPLLAREDLGDLAGGILNGALLDVVRDGRYDQLLEWVERLDTWLPESRRGLFAPFSVAGRHLRDDKEDHRILDQQPPEVRQIIEMILREAEKPSLYPTLDA